jgi:hypothetical protein
LRQLISIYIFWHRLHPSDYSRSLTHAPRIHRFDRLADAPVENGQIHKKYDIIQPDGLAGVGERVDPGDVYINKQTPANANDNSFTGQASAVSYKNSPMMYKSPIAGNIDKVMITDTDNDQTLIKVLIRQTRRPELGDKFSSRHGQKGVCGLIVNQEDMPFNDQGICPGRWLQCVPHTPPRLSDLDRRICVTHTLILVFLFSRHDHESPWFPVTYDRRKDDRASRRQGMCRFGFTILRL